MKKEKMTLQDKLAKRKYKRPNKFEYFVYYFLMTKIVGRKYKAHYEIIDDINECKGPKFLIWNHLSRVDHMYMLKATYPDRISMVAGYNEFFRSHLHFVFKLNQIIPKKNYVNDIPSIKAMNSIIKQNGLVCFAPEGMSSIYGTNQPVTPGTAHFLKHHKIPVYFMEMRGEYLVSTKVIQDERYGDTYGKMMLLFTPEDLERLSEEEITDIINEKFKHDEYLWNKEKRIKYKHKGNKLAKNLSHICYRCPVCGSEFEMEEDGNILRCKKCGNAIEINDYYDFLKASDNAKFPISPSKWVEWERCLIIRDIRHDENYSFTEHVKLGYLPKYKYVSKKKTSELCGEGDLTIDHSGIHYRGTKLAEEFNFDLDYNGQYSLPIVTDTSFFSLYVNGEYHDIFPDRAVVGKMLLLVEEMHRLHVNVWKNFKWNDYMYDESVDLEEVFFKDVK